MNVRTWFTISALAMLALAAAFVFRFFVAQIQPPEILVRADDTRLQGVYAGSCWPQRGGELRCEEPELTSPPTVELPRAGNLRIVAAFPAPPEGGTITIASDRGRTVVEEGWTAELAYSLDPGTYLMTAEARYPSDAFVRYLFRFRAA